MGVMVEYLGSNPEGGYLVDHWIKGPHHLWVDVATGKFIRMWQPWNGLQVFDPAKWTVGPEAHTKGLFSVPPPLCKKGGAAFRIHCTDDGHNDQDNNFTAPVEFLGARLSSEKLDTARADG